MGDFKATEERQEGRQEELPMFQYIPREDKKKACPITETRSLSTPPLEIRPLDSTAIPTLGWRLSNPHASFSLKPQHCCHPRPEPRLSTVPRCLPIGQGCATGLESSRIPLPLTAASGRSLRRRLGSPARRRGDSRDPWQMLRETSPSSRARPLPGVRASSVRPQAIADSRPLRGGKSFRRGRL